MPKAVYRSDCCDNTTGRSEIRTWQGWARDVKARNRDAHLRLSRD